MWFIVVEVEQETRAPPPKKNPGSAPDLEPTWAVNQHGKKREERNFQCVNQQHGERGLVRYPLDAKERQIFKSSGLYSRI